MQLEPWLAMTRIEYKQTVTSARIFTWIWSQVVIRSETSGLNNNTPAVTTASTSLASATTESRGRHKSSSSSLIPPDFPVVHLTLSRYSSVCCWTLYERWNKVELAFISICKLRPVMYGSITIGPVNRICAYRTGGDGMVWRKVGRYIQYGAFPSLALLDSTHFWFQSHCFPSQFSTSLTWVGAVYSGSCLRRILASPQCLSILKPQNYSINY